MSLPGNINPQTRSFMELFSASIVGRHLSKLTLSALEQGLDQQVSPCEMIWIQLRSAQVKSAPLDFSNRVSLLVGLSLLLFTINLRHLACPGSCRVQNPPPYDVGRVFGDADDSSMARCRVSPWAARSLIPGCGSDSDKRFTILFEALSPIPATRMNRRVY